MNNNQIMNINEECLIKYLSFGKYEQKFVTFELINFLRKKGVNFSFSELNPVYNIIDEFEFLDKYKYN